MDIYPDDISCGNVFYTAVFSGFYRICVLAWTVQDRHSAGRIYHIAYSDIAHRASCRTCGAVGDITYRTADRQVKKGKKARKDPAERGEPAKGAAKAHAELEVDENGCMRFSESIYEELTRTGSGYDKLIGEYPFLWTAIWRQKPVMLSEPWSYTHITGMYFPFFAECNVNTAQPDFSIPYTAAHESAHSRGIAFENECNFLAFLSCINSEYPEFRYSGYMEAFKYCSNALFAYDIDMWQQAHDMLSPEMIADFSAENKYIHDHEVELKVGNVSVSVSQVSGAVNDSFIKVQGVADGGLSYGRVTELILAYYADKL